MCQMFYGKFSCCQFGLYKIQLPYFDFIRLFVEGWYILKYLYIFAKLRCGLHPQKVTDVQFEII